MGLYTKIHHKCAAVLLFQPLRQCSQEEGYVGQCSGVNAAVYDPELWGPVCPGGYRHNPES